MLNTHLFIYSSRCDSKVLQRLPQTNSAICLIRSETQISCGEHGNSWVVIIYQHTRIYTPLYSRNTFLVWLKQPALLILHKASSVKLSVHKSHISIDYSAKNYKQLCLCHWLKPGMSVTYGDNYTE